jgi:hypothetical protein
MDATISEVQDTTSNFTIADNIAYKVALCVFTLVLDYVCGVSLHFVHLFCSAMLPATLCKTISHVDMLSNVTIAGDVPCAVLHHVLICTFIIDFACVV